MAGGVPGRLLDQTQGPCANLNSAAGNAALGFTCRRVRRIGTPYPFRGERMIALEGRDWLAICPECAVHAGIIPDPTRRAPVHVEAWMEATPATRLGIAAATSNPSRPPLGIPARETVPVAPHVTATRRSLGVLGRLAAVWLVTWVRVRIDVACRRVADAIRRQLNPDLAPVPVEVTVLDRTPLELTATIAPGRSWEYVPDREHVRTTR